MKYIKLYETYTNIEEYEISEYIQKYKLDKHFNFTPIIEYINSLNKNINIEFIDLISNPDYKYLLIQPEKKYIQHYISLLPLNDEYYIIMTCTNQKSECTLIDGSENIITTINQILKNKNYI